MDHGGENENWKEEESSGEIWNYSTFQETLEAVGRRFCYPPCDLASYTRKILGEKRGSETHDLHRGNHCLNGNEDITSMEN